MRRGDAYQGVDEILQADVMRFLAIIAICLMAILALVRGAEPIEAARAPQPVPPAEPQLTVRPPARPAPVAEAPAAEWVPERVPGRVPEPRPEPVPALPKEPAVAERVPAPPPEPVPSEPAVDPDANPAADPAEEGLSLRFASDQDFLRLVNRGDVRLFAFREGEVLTVGAGLELAPASTPGQLHELLPETIPAVMTEALRRRAGAGDFKWGVVMPDRIARAIRGYVERGAAGELVIDRFGEVRHHEA